MNHKIKTDKRKKIKTQKAQAKLAKTSLQK